LKIRKQFVINTLKLSWRVQSLFQVKYLDCNIADLTEILIVAGNAI